jgi:hypothetical protein
MLPTQPRPPARIRRPVPGWPWWIAFGILVPTTLISVGVVSWMTGRSELSLAEQQRLLESSVVVSGTFLRSEAASGYPQIDATYTATLPDTAPGDLAGSVQELEGVRDIGFPPVDDFPPTQDFLITYDGNAVVVEDTGDPGTLSVVTGSDVASLQRAVDFESRVVAVGWVLLVVWLTVIPTIAITLSVRRRRTTRQTAR